MATDLDFDAGRATVLAQETGAALVVRTTAAVLRRAKILCPSRTGRLRNSLRMKIHRSPGSIEGEISTDVFYAGYVHNGTRAHRITPVPPGGFMSRGGSRQPAPPRGFLRFGGHGGRVVFTHSVWHPGTRARPFLAQAIAEVAPGDGFAVS